MSTKENRENKLSTLDKLINEITVDAYDDDEQLWAFRQLFENDVILPADGFVIGEPVSVVEIEYGSLIIILEFVARCNADLKPAADTF